MLVNGKKFSAYSVREKGKFYEMDIDNYGGPSEVIINVPASKICDSLHWSKKCSYMQVASHGFYILNGRDDFGLNKNSDKTRLCILRIQHGTNPVSLSDQVNQ